MKTIEETLDSLIDSYEEWKAIKEARLSAFERVDESQFEKIGEFMDYLDGHYEIDFDNIDISRELEILGIKNLDNVDIIF